MHKIKRNEKFKRFKSVNGHKIEVNIVQKRLCLNIKIQNTNYYVYKNIWWPTFICVINVFCYVLHIISFKTVIVFGFIILLFAICRIIKDDNLVIINGLGMQLTTTYLMQTKTVFIPIESIKKIFINEVLQKQKVIYMLTLLIKDKNTKEKLMPLFMEMCPTLSCLQLIYSRIFRYLNNDCHLNKFIPNGDIHS